MSVALSEPGSRGEQEGQPWTALAVKNLVHMRADLGMKWAEIAARMKRTEDSCKVRFARALQAEAMGKLSPEMREAAKIADLDAFRAKYARRHPGRAAYERIPCLKCHRLFATEDRRKNRLCAACKGGEIFDYWRR